MALLELGGTCQERIAVLRELGRPRKAIQLWRACPPDPHVSSWLGEMAWAYFDLGQFGRASALLDTANLSWYGQKEAEVHALAGRYESAARILDDWASRGEHELASWELHCTKRPVRKHLVYWCKSDEPLRKEARRLRCLTNTVSDLGWTSNRWRAAPCTPTRLREEPDVIKGRLVKTLGKGKSVGFRRRLAARLATLERLVALTLVRSAF
jgi:hypothetical protein